MVRISAENMRKMSAVTSKILWSIYSASLISKVNNFITWNFWVNFISWSLNPYSQILCRCHEIKSPPKQSLPLTDMKSPQETLYRNKVSPIEIESPVYDTKSLPSENRHSSLGWIFIIKNSINYVHAMHVIVAYRNSFYVYLLKRT